MGKSFRDLQVWREAMEVAVSVYHVTAAFPQHEQYGLTSQMRRAAVSISSNIAEGSGRDGRKDFRHFVLVARGSVCELQTQVMLAVRLGYCTQPVADELLCRVDGIGRMLNGLAAFLNSKIKASQTSTARPPATNH